MDSSVVFAARTNQLKTPLCHFAKQRMASTATFILLFCGSCLLVLSTAAPRNYWQQSNGGYRRKCKAWMHAGTTCHPVHAVEINIHLWAHNEIWVVNNHSLTTCVRTYSIVNIIYTLCTSDKNCVSCLCSEYQINKRCMVLLPEMGGQTSTITTANAYTNTTCSWDSGLRLNNGVRVSAHFMFMICIHCVNFLHIFTYAASVYQNQLAGGGKYSIIL